MTAWTQSRPAPLADDVASANTGEGRMPVRVCMVVNNLDVGGWRRCR